MLIREKVIAALERKKATFTDFATHRHQQRRLIDERLDAFFQLDRAEIDQRLASEALPGALPTAELDRSLRLRIRFDQQWRNHEEARAWALETLRNHTVIAVDGSQITPNKDVSPPVGAVQIGWFVNDHRSGGSYIKDVEFEVLTPADFEDEDDAADSLSAVSIVNQARFEKECVKLTQLMVEHSSEQSEIAEQPLCLFDGSLIISFAGQLQATERRIRSYLQHITSLLQHSETLQIPLLAFVDSSLSHDLSTMIRLVVDKGEADKPTDGELFGIATQADGNPNRAALLPNWGDRTPFFWCAREDNLSKLPRTADLAAYYRDVAFCYITLAMERPPARLEIPRWLFESGLAEEIVNRVRAECIVGGGYPYAIETADAAAVISMADRERFYGLFQQFLQDQKLPFTQSRKARSKMGRR